MLRNKLVLSVLLIVPLVVVVAVFVPQAGVFKKVVTVTLKDGHGEVAGTLTCSIRKFIGFPWTKSIWVDDSPTLTIMNHRYKSPGVGLSTDETIPMIHQDPGSHHIIKSATSTNPTGMGDPDFVWDDVRQVMTYTTTFTLSFEPKAAKSWQDIFDSGTQAAALHVTYYNMSLPVTDGIELVAE